MRTVKKINGYLVVRFNEREKAENPGLGSYGVIDEEVYTGDLDFDRSEMEYDDADSLEVAVEQARGLDAPEADEVLRMERETFEHLPNRPGAVKPEGARKVYALGMLLEADCPENDCRVFLNVFRMARATDEALDVLEGYAAQVMERELRKLLTKLWEMYLSNYAVRKYREGRPDKGTTPPEGYTGGELTKACWQRLMRRERETKTLLKALSAPLSAEGSQ